MIRALRQAWRDAYTRCNAYVPTLRTAGNSGDSEAYTLALVHYDFLAHTRDAAYDALISAPTLEQILALRIEAGQAGDYDLVETCFHTEDGRWAARARIAHILADAEGSQE